MSGSFRLREDYERHGKDRIFGGQTGPVGVVLILQLRGRSAEVVGEIFLDVGECGFQSRVAYDRDVGGWLCQRGAAAAVVTLWLKMFFTR